MKAAKKINIDQRSKKLGLRVLPPEPLPDHKLLTTHEIAILLQVDASTVSKWIDKDTLHGYRTPGGHRRVPVSDVRVMLKKFNMWIPPELVS